MTGRRVAVATDWVVVVACSGGDAKGTIGCGSGVVVESVVGLACFVGFLDGASTAFAGSFVEGASARETASGSALLAAGVEGAGMFVEATSACVGGAERGDSGSGAGAASVIVSVVSMGAALAIALAGDDGISGCVVCKFF